MRENEKFVANESGLLLDSQPLDAKGTQARLTDDDGADSGGDGNDGTDR